MLFPVRLHALVFMLKPLVSDLHPGTQNLVLIYSSLQICVPVMGHVLTTQVPDLRLAPKIDLSFGGKQSENNFANT